MVKNALIVPVGSKGGFVVKRPPARRPRGAAAGGDRLLSDVPARAARPDRQLRRRPRGRRPTGSSATTTTIHTWSSPPTREPPRSRTSPTRSPPSMASGSATRSPPAARTATTTSRWGSPRAARGSRSSATSASWAPTSRPSDFTAVGIGDMSGDVFGNGMLLLAAHHACWPRSTICTCSSTPIRIRRPSYAERRRCSSCPRSSWSDYDPALISAGGGVFLADAPSRSRSPPEVSAALGIEADQPVARRPDPRAAARARRPAVQRRHRHLCEGGRRDQRRRRGQGQRRGPGRRRRAALPGRRRGRKPRLHPARTDRVRAAGRPRRHRRADQHGRDRQRGRRQLLRPRGEHQDPARGRRSPPAR